MKRKEATKAPSHNNDDDNNKQTILHAFVLEILSASVSWCFG